MSREYLLYLPPEVDQVGEKELVCERYKNLLSMIDREYQTVRTYIVCIDIPKTDAQDKLPYLTLDGDVIGFAEGFDKIMVRTNRAEDGTTFDEDIL